MRPVRDELVRRRFERAIARQVRPEEFGAFGGASVIHPPFTSNARKRISIGARTYVLAGAWLELAEGRPEAEIRIGSGTYLGRDLTIHCASRVLIGNDVMASDRIHIADFEFGADADAGRPAGAPAPVSIGNGTFLGTGAIVLPGVTVGNGSLVAAGAVVTSDVPPNAVVAGNPARVVRHYDRAAGAWRKGGPVRGQP